MNWSKISSKATENPQSHNNPLNSRNQSPEYSVSNNPKPHIPTLSTQVTPPNTLNKLINSVISSHQALVYPCPSSESTPTPPLIRPSKPILSSKRNKNRSVSYCEQKTQPWTPEKHPGYFYQVNGKGIFKINKNAKILGGRIIDIGEVVMFGFVYHQLAAFLIGGTLNPLFPQVFNSTRVVDFQKLTILRGGK